MRTTLAAILVLSAALATAAPAQQPAPAAPAATQPGQKTLEQMTVPELLALAQQLRDVGQISQAQSVVKIVLGREDKNVDAHTLAGELALAVGQNESTLEAQREFNIARQINATDFRANLGLGKIYVRSHVWRQATFHLEIADKVAPPDRVREVKTMLAESYRNSGRMTDAFKAVEDAIKAEPQSFDAHQMYVALLIDANRLDEALVESRKTIDLMQQQVQAASNKRESLLHLYQAYSARLAVLQKLGNACFKKLPNGQTSKELIEGKQREITEITKQSIEIYLIQAEMRLTDSYFDMIVHAEQAVQFSPNDVEALMILARLYRNTSQFEKAVRVYQRVADLDPGNAEASRELEALGAAAPAAAPPPASQPAPQMP